jgi:hypothetical protein
MPGGGVQEAERLLLVTLATAVAYVVPPSSEYEIKKFAICASCP